MKKILSVLLAVAIFTMLSTTALAGEALTAEATVASAPVYTAEVDARGCILMDAKTGKVLFEKNADEAFPPASVTKVMTMLLVFEAIDAGLLSYTDMISVSENAASMGGSQIFLAPGEKMSVDDLLKGLIVASGNDAAVALAEALAGSEEAFVARMNQRAAELGMKNTHFENTNGLDDTTENHVISARDLAIATKEVLKHPKVLEYSSIWMDTIRDGAFGLTNTNRLIRFYDGATGLKTGSTSKAKFCISATAERGGLSLIAVIMGSSTRDTRNELAKALFDFGFANYTCYTDPRAEMEAVRVTGGVQNTLATYHEAFEVTLDKAGAAKIETRVDIPEKLEAPIAEGQRIGTVTYLVNGEEIGASDILAAEAVAKLDFGTLFSRLFTWFLMAEKK
jgi:D-alanyl-D-alanine carboxypeptidase (penicillin-binding protein 5/6)